MGKGIKKGVEVEVLRGRSRAKRGKVLRILPGRELVIIEGLNVKKRHTKPSMKQKQGGILEKEAPIHVSNLRLVGGEAKPAAKA